MRVLQINSVCGYGSTGRIATDLYDVLEEEGHECCIAYGRGIAPEGYNTKKIGNKFDFYSHVLKTRIFDLHGFGSNRETKKLIKTIEEYNPDVIHLHNIHGYYLNIEALFGYLSAIKTPVVWLLHDQWSFSGHSAYFDVDRDGNVPTKNLSKIQKNDYPRSWLKDNSEKNYQVKKKLFTKIENMTIVTPSNWLLELTEKSFLSIYSGRLIYNGIDLDVFKPTKSCFKEKNNLLNKKIILGIANVWEERKGIHYFEMLAEKLNDEYQVVLIGVDNKTKKTLNKKIMSIQRTSNTQELAEIYSSADIFVNPTLEDNFPTTNIEALACGTPVITFNTGGSPEAVDERTGIVIEKGDGEELYRAILKISDNNFSGTDCVNRAKKFDKKSVYRQYINLYSELFVQDLND
ncbi:glycosyltransferase [Trichococcus alkaliphilus]|uniref:glycosyltransferase n=1 Tax=Trichococcus alkaliphilus TaxID=2052943 RepID=UPI000D0B46D5|nr:glycosyltransferase [Trichococcus alkaliphilus]